MQSLKLTLLAVPLAAFAAGASARAPQETAPPQTKPPQQTRAAEEFAAAKADFEKAKEEYRTLKARATTEQERDKLFADKYPRAEVYAERMEQIAKKNPKDPAAADCLVWVLETNRGTTTVTDPALELLLHDHLQSPALAEACKALERANSPKTETFLATVLAQSPHRETKGVACFVLAKVLSSRATLLHRLQSNFEPGLAPLLEESWGREGLKALRKANVDALTRAAEDRLEQVVANYGDLPWTDKDLGATAKDDLFELRNLAVGKVAPEIEGKDVDGRSFKLSDYRGKVVLLDFWGFWCVPCRAMIPDQRALVAKFADQPFVLLGVNSDQTLDEPQKKLAAEQMTWRQWLDGGSTGPIATAWNVSSWPMTYIIDADGVIRFKDLCNLRVEEAIEGLLAKMPAKKPAGKKDPTKKPPPKKGSDKE